MTADTPETLRAYEADFDNFGTWRKAHGFQPWPVRPEIVGAYLAAPGPGYGVGGTRTALSGSPFTEEREEIRLAVGRMKAAVDRQNYSIDKDGVLAREKRNHARDFIGCGCSADREAIEKSR